MIKIKFEIKMSKICVSFLHTAMIKEYMNSMWGTLILFARYYQTMKQNIYFYRGLLSNILKKK
jgi:hypothetical protein